MHCAWHVYDNCLGAVESNNLEQSPGLVSEHEDKSNCSQLILTIFIIDTHIKQPSFHIIHSGPVLRAVGRKLHNHAN